MLAKGALQSGAPDSGWIGNLYTRMARVLPALVIFRGLTNNLLKVIGCKVLLHEDIVHGYLMIDINVS